MIKRMIGAAKLDTAIYEEVEADTSATQQALTVVVLVALATGIGTFGSGGPLGLVVGIVAGIGLWALWAWVTYFVGTTILQMYPLAGTIFEKSSTPLKSWFYAMYLMASTRTGISAKQLERELGVTYKTAWRMFKQIRSILAEDVSLEGLLVEVDETFIGGTLESQKR